MIRIIRLIWGISNLRRIIFFVLEIPISTWINISVMENTFNVAVFIAVLSLTGMYTDEDEVLNL